MTTTLIDDEQLLAPTPDVNYKELTAQPSPQDFLVLTRVKGAVTVAQLCTTSGLGRDKTLDAIGVLLDVGLLQMLDADGKPIPRAKPQPKPEPEPPKPEPPKAEPLGAEPQRAATLQENTGAYDLQEDTGGYADDVDPAQMSAAHRSQPFDGSTRVYSPEPESSDQGYSPEAESSTRVYSPEQDSSTRVLDPAVVQDLTGGSGDDEPGFAMIDDEVVDEVADGRTEMLTSFDAIQSFSGSRGPATAEPTGSSSLHDQLFSPPESFEAGGQPLHAFGSDPFGDSDSDSEFGIEIESEGPDVPWTPTGPAIVIDEPEPPPAKVEPAPAFEVEYNTLNSAAPESDEDDLFMPASPAHKDRLDGTAPIKRDHGKVRVEAAKPAVRAAEAKQTPVVVVDVARYRFFPVKFESHQSKHPVVEGVAAEIQQEINYVFDHIEFIDFYQLFGVETGADRREIREAYFEMSKRFHPDKFFRDDVSGLTDRVEGIFRFVTKGYQILSKKDKRSQYDQALQQARAEADRSAERTTGEEDRKRQVAADMLERRAAQLEAQGQFAQAAAEFKKVGTLRRDAHAFLKAASLLLRANLQLDEAASLARGVIRELPGEIEPRLVLGQIYEKNQMLAEAERVLGEAEQIAPGDPSVRAHLERIRSQR